MPQENQLSWVRMAISPTAEGFRAAFRRPSLTVAEIMWRWTAGAAAAALLLFGLFEYLSTLPVTNGELLFLRTRHPYFVAEALARILRGSLNRVVAAGMLAALMLSALWMVAASVGRIVTVRCLLDYFRGDVASNVRTSERVSLPVLLRLNFLRVAVALAALFGFVGATILAGFASPAANPQPGVAFFLFLPMAALICWIWWSLNWLLSLAGMFAVRNGEDAVGSLVAAVALCRERTGSVFAVSTWTGLAHLTVFVGATTVVSMPLGFAPVIPWRLVFAVVIVLTLAYLAVADWLYMARLAGYVCIAETPEALLKPVPPAPLPTPPPASGPPVQTKIDRDEPILSDIPNLSVET
jgi:hypothetical protein